MQRVCKRDDRENGLTCAGEMGRFRWTNFKKKCRESLSR